MSRWMKGSAFLCQVILSNPKLQFCNVQRILEFLHGPATEIQLPARYEKLAEVDQLQCILHQLQQNLRQIEFYPCLRIKFGHELFVP